MMKLILQLEKNKIFWSLFWLSLGFFLLRLPSLFEPNWYGDEGIYQVIGRAINHGIPLYSGIFDNKPPLLYLIYAFFNGDQFSVRLTSLIAGLLSVWTFFFLSYKLLKKINISIITTSIFAGFFAIPLFEGNIANAENFMLFPITLAAVLIYKTIGNKHQTKFSFLNSHFSILFTAGLLLGIAFLFKIVAIFDLAAFVCFLIIINLPEKITWSRSKESQIKNHKSWFFSLLRDSCFIILGFLIPLAITIAYFFLNNSLGDFVRATFLGNIDYVSSGNKFIISQGFLIIKLLMLMAFVLLLTVKRSKLSHAAIFILLWSGFSLFNTLFSQKPYTHYLLVLLPSFCLLLGMIIDEKVVKTRQILLIVLLIIITPLFATFKPYGLGKTVLYYQNAFLFVTGKRNVTDYQAFFDKKTPRDYELASYLKLHLNTYDRVFVWGDHAQIYTLSDTLPINKYTVAYHITHNRIGFEETQQTLIRTQPRYVIVLPEASAFPFKLAEYYVSKFSINNATIYERSL